MAILRADQSPILSATEFSPVCNATGASPPTINTGKGAKNPWGPRLELLTDMIALDCEMMRSTRGTVLGRVSIVAYDGQMIYDTFVCHPASITITNTDGAYSGIRWRDIDPVNGAQPFSEVQQTVKDLVGGRTLVGHDIEKDFRVLQIDRRELQLTVRDTQKIAGYQRYANARSQHGPGLKKLALEVLGRRIQAGEHSSVEDAVATMVLYKYAEEDSDKW